MKAFSFPRRIVFLLPLIFGLLYAIGFLALPLLNRLDEIYYDWRLVHTMPQTPDDRIVIVDIDEKSLATIGRWPWNRSVMAKLTRELFDRQQSRAVAFDLVFAEPDTSSGYPMLQQIAGPGGSLQDARLAQQIKQQAEALDYDTLFAESLSGKNAVLGYYWTNDRGGYKNGTLPKPVLDKHTLKQQFQNPKRTGTTLTQWDGYGSNYEPLANAAALQGHFTPFTDPEDGVVRRVPMIVEHEGLGYEALSLSVFRLLLGTPHVEAVKETDSLWASKQGNVHALRLIQNQRDRGSFVDIPVDTAAMALVPFRGQPGPQGNAFKYISASDLLQGKLPPLALQGKAVFVGTTAPGLLDVRITPVSKAYPGVEVHANLLSGMLDNTIATSPSYKVGYELCLLLLLSTMLMLVLPRVAALSGAAVAASLILGALVFNWLAYTRAGLVLPLSSGLVLILATYFAYLAYAYFVESKAKRQITRLFGTYVPPELVDEMARDPEQYSLAAQSKEMTVMFCDIRDFTRLSETMSPTKLSELVNQVFSVVTEVVQTNRGTLDKYLGDAVMAFWGAPVDAGNHAELAVRTALAISPAIEALNKRNRAANLPEISLGIGVNTGTMFVGDMGSNVRRAYTVVGDAVNLASRLESLTRLYAVDVICGKETRQQCDMFTWRELDTVRVKGKQASVTLYEPLSPERALAETGFSALYAELLSAYRQQNWGLTETLLSRFPANRAALWRLFTQRLANLRANPPSAVWDGSTRLDSK